jgi:diguanylate cyclase (GGDEF)-like protein
MLSKSKRGSFALAYAETLSAGHKRLAEGEVDVIILDLMLPDCEGVDTFEDVKSLVPNIPIIILTGLDDEGLAINVVHNGAQDYMVKGQVDNNLLTRSIYYAIERKKLEEQLKAAAITDDLTGLFNRRGFFTLAEQQCKLANRSKRRMLLLYMDLDNMKEINDKLGHVSGDQALWDTANVIRKTFRDSDIKGRVGGDEFAVLLTDPAPATEKSVVKHFQDNLQTFNVRGNRNYQLSLSMGFSEFDPERPCTIENLVSSADSSMYKNKRKKADKELMTESRREVKERRLHERFETNDACWAEIGVSDRIRVKNISASGISLTNMHHLMTSRFHSMKINCANERIPVKGVMVWSQLKEADQYEAGLKFIGLSDRDKNHLESIISNLSD